MSATKKPAATAAHGSSAVIYARDGALEWRSSSVSANADAVTKIVVGTLEGNTKVGLSSPMPRDLATWFPNLTHVHLWNIAGLSELPALPPGLRCLDIRRCPELVSLPRLPAALDTLILEECPALAIRAEDQRIDFAELTELSLRRSIGIDQEWLHAVLQSAPMLRTLDASNCTQITSIPAWSASPDDSRLEEIRLDGCTALAGALPPWPPRLRRIGLRGATAVTRVPDFHDGLDFIDLAHTRSLAALPERRGNPATLFLFGGGLRVPPVSEQGEDKDDNVAETTAAYFRDVDLTGKGEVKRCKVLILGNGGAGKTCLSLALLGMDPEDAKKKYGSTHGVQFWDWRGFKASIDGKETPVSLHVWDFGGQEIYHNTHRLFMSTGALFVVVWKPEQDGKQPPPEACEYQDQWRPLRYWIDLIHLASPNKPRIVIVCSHHRTSTAALRARLREQLGPEYDGKFECCFVDSYVRKSAPEKAGQFPALERWLRNEVGRVIVSQGTEVPTYWEIAQGMVEG
ncbi:MAG: hypothetical protein U0575_10285 [Phycisphaerales bacterium]